MKESLSIVNQAEYRIGHSHSNHTEDDNSNISTCSEYCDYENQIKNEEKKAYQKFQSAVKKISSNEVYDWFQEPAMNRIILSLEKIGFDKILIKTLFMIASPAWRQMKLDTQNNIIFQPFMMKKIFDVQTGIIEELNNETDSFLKFYTPWIILPRVYDHLQREDSQTLFTYLEFLKKSENQEFKIKLVQIIITYFGNYSFKFRSNNQMQSSVSDMLFYGYVAMFWKNLKSPPTGFEECFVFKSFLKLIQLFPENIYFLNNNKLNQIHKMEAALRNIFPLRRTFGVYVTHKIDHEKIFLALRHGPEGIKIALDHFCIDQNLKKEKTNGGIPNAMLPKEIWTFLKLITKKYESETLKTKEFIRGFINNLYNNYSKASALLKHRSDKQEEFVKRRLLTIIRDFTTSHQFYIIERNKRK
ncbi:MAG: hypothetical protein DRH93_09395 [Deltaproteobacteria bacterium]|nr:MAG: hypothetical protein DRH93_09395 [Deltaproteobacteria bacterium]